ncbi:MAG: hypothetical protein JWP12_1282 [Bacteroidetes bacterium]|nr:hypothetical protein [Bacteroidota bacterium]
MKTKSLLILFILFSFSAKNFAQNSDDVLNLLIQKKLITETEADSLRADNALKQQEQKEKQKFFQILANKQIQIGGYTQLRYQSFQEAGKPDGFDVRLARLDIKGNINPYWEYRLQTDFAGSPKIVDAYAAYKPFDFLKITVGQLKVPLSPENIAESSKLESIDRAQVVEALAARSKDVIGNQNGHDIGIQASGSVVKIRERYLLDYYIAYLNGAGVNVSDNNESKDVAGRLVFHPFAGFDIGGAYYNGLDKFGTPAKDQQRLRYAGEIAFTYKGANIKAEWIHGQDGIIQREGWFAQATYFVWKRKVQLLAKYDTYDPNVIHLPDTSPTQHDISTYYIFGANYYFNDWTKLQVNYSYRQEQTKQINNDLISAQVQISF